MKTKGQERRKNLAVLDYEANNTSSRTQVFWCPAQVFSSSMRESSCFHWCFEDHKATGWPREGRAALYTDLSRKQRQATGARSSVRPGEQTNIVGTKKDTGKARFDSGPVTAENNWWLCEGGQKAICPGGVAKDTSWFYNILSIFAPRTKKIAVGKWGSCDLDCKGRRNRSRFCCFLSLATC